VAKQPEAAATRGSTSLTALSGQSKGRVGPTRESESAYKGDAKGVRSVLARWLERKPLEFDRLIHERMRLGILSALAVNESLTFNDLKNLLRTTDGNLSVHARKLEEAQYITCEKYFDGRLPKTEFRLASLGRRALERYLDQMETLIRVTRER
jgi:DNA-binding MarR family transcriptional regulator